MKIQKTKNDEIVRRKPEYVEGLSNDEVELRYKNKLVNKKEDVSTKSYLQIVLGNIFTFFNFLMFGIAAVYIFFVGPSAIGNLSFLLIMTCNLLIGTIQECKAKHTINKLKLLNNSKITVIRDSKEVDIDQENIVLDDIIKFKPGDQIPVDCYVVYGNIETNEALLTGESDPIKKSINSLLYSGSFVVSGDCYAIADKIGNNTYIHSIESKAKGFNKPKSELLVSINSIIKKLTCVVIPLGLLTFWQALISNAEFKKAIISGGTAMVGMVPCGMVLLSSVAMAAGVMKLARTNTLVQNLYSVESLARIDTLCLDKTGTLTDGTMCVEDVIQFSKDDLNDIISTYLSAFDSSNQTSKALLDKYGCEQKFKITNKIPFSSSRKYSAVEFNNSTYLLGAPDFLTNDKEILDVVNSKAKNGLRVLLLMKNKNTITDDFEVNITDNEILSMFIIRDNIRPEVNKTMKWFTNNGIEIRVISGDNIDTVSYIAKQSGIPNWDKAIDLSTVPEEDLRDTILDNYIFGRVTPEQKALIVDVLHSIGRKVAITGDGVNDVLAMKKSDCSVAMANGSPATRSVANVVLMDSNFSNMPKTVMEGRRVVNNIQRSSTLFLMKVFFIMFLTFFCLFLGINLPIETSVLGIVNIFITGISSLILSIEPSYSKISGNFNRNVFSKAIPAGFFMFLPVMMLIIITFINTGLDIDAVNISLQSKVSVMAFCITIAGFVIFFKICQPFNKFRATLFTTILSISVFILLAFPDFFLQNSTTFWGGMFEKYSNLSGSDIVISIVSELLQNIFSFELYKRFLVSDWILIICFSIFSFTLYYFSDKFIMKALQIKMFSAALFDELPEEKKKEKH